MTTLDDIISSDIINSNYPLISEAAKSVATPVIRKTATIGGNLLVNNRCTFYNQSKEWRDSIGSCLKDVGDICQVTGGNKSCYARNVSDSAASLMALGSEIILLTPSGSIQKPLTELYLPCGIKSHELDEHSILIGITVPIKAGKYWYRKLRLRKTLDFTSLTVATTVDSQKMARICLNGVSMSPVLIKDSLASLTLESIIKQARKYCKTVENDLMPLKYRREMINVYLKECWEKLH
jgi:4-hydroxybenzoyl-CoA reductase subunit beta